MAWLLVLATSSRLRKHEANRTGGFCVNYACPAGYVHISGDTTLTDSNGAAGCCARSCVLYQCPVGFAMKAHPSSIAGAMTGMCCDAGTPCFQFQCPQNFILKADPTIPGNTRDVCCNPSCVQHQCAASLGLLPNASSLAGTTDTACCGPACSLVGCPAPKVLIDNADMIAGGDIATCCTDTCQIQTCPPNFVLKPTAASIAYSCDANLFPCLPVQAVCCDSACTTFACPAGMIRDPGAARIIANDTTCCVNVTR